VFQSINTIPQFVNVPVTFTAGASSSTVVTAVANGASFQQAFAPGMILSVFGRSLASSTQVATSVPLPLSLGGTSVTVNGQPAPLYYASPTQLNIQVPYETEAGNAILVVNNNGQIASLAFRVTLSAPGIFVGSGSLVPISSANRGDAVVFFITGEGDVSPFVPTGTPPPATASLSQLPAPRLPLTLTVGGVTVTPLFVGIPYGLVGVTQINFVVPQTVPSGVQPVVVKVGSATSASANLTINGSGGGASKAQASSGAISFALPAADAGSFDPVAITSIGWGGLTASPAPGTASAPDSWLVAPRRTDPAAHPVDSPWKKDGGRK
jgi:uncharacterized protein (TIGR03437 family)